MLSGAAYATRNLNQSPCQSYTKGREGLMAGIFDRLQSELDDRKKDGGISTLDLADLPSPLRKLMRLMLREVELSYQELCEATDKMPQDDRLSRAELDQALETLSKNNWLIRRGEGEMTSYKVNLRRKASSKLSQNIWSALGDKIEQQKESSAQDQDAS
jgi:hypothetical protein